MLYFAIGCIKETIICVFIVSINIYFSTRSYNLNPLSPLVLFKLSFNFYALRINYYVEV